MKTLTMEFEDHGIVLEFGAGHRELNTYYEAACRQYLDPKALALSVGRVPEDEHRELAMRSYACGVALRWDPPMTEDEAFAWFVEHPFEFDTLFSYADSKENFTEDGTSDEHRQP